MGERMLNRSLLNLFQIQTQLQRTIEKAKQSNIEGARDQLDEFLNFIKEQYFVLDEKQKNVKIKDIEAPKVKQGKNINSITKQSVDLSYIDKASFTYNIKYIEMPNSLSEFAKIFKLNKNDIVRKIKSYPTGQHELSCIIHSQERNKIYLHQAQTSKVLRYDAVQFTQDENFQELKIIENIQGGIMANQFIIFVGTRNIHYFPESYNQVSIKTLETNNRGDFRDICFDKGRDLLILAFTSNLMERSSIFVMNVTKEEIQIIERLNDGFNNSIIRCKKVLEPQKFMFACQKGFSSCYISSNGTISQQENYLPSYQNICDFEEIRKGEYIFCTREKCAYFIYRMNDQQIHDIPLGQSQQPFSMRLINFPGIKTQSPFLINYENQYLNIVDYRFQKAFRLGLNNFKAQAFIQYGNRLVVWVDSIGGVSIVCAQISEDGNNIITKYEISNVFLQIINKITKS
ncbi:UNKNOWN [Stylonychia lemnae]|uniref:Uncharacterized protein n=1 Tax=Stylonychia lemnae TaxID=5949 RepID=A0A078AKQ8_STYLE|nr:UNKNOWN [Stylonychia lemnae]|eukprot:CDW82955.1 UNKNOWN [Stylonychia lemnae]